MPICTREGLDIKPTCTDDFKDDEEVFYCETTKEIFRDYEEYFRRIMLINATIWACESTGKDNLTYAEALKSERKARKLLNAFKEQLRAPTLIVVKTAQQGCYRSLFNLTYQFLKDRFFLKETVVAAKPNKSTYHECDIVEIVTPKIAPADGIYDPSTLMYRVRKTSSTSSHDTWVTSPNYIRRRRSDFQHEFLQFFIKENVRRVDGILEPKEAPYKKYVTNAGVTMETFFVGKLPDWKPSKRKSDIEKKQGTLNKFLIKKDDDGSISEPLEQGELEKRVQERLDQINREAEEKKRKAHERREFVLQLYANYASKSDDLERNDQQLLPLYKPLKSIIHSKLFSDFMAIYEFLTTFSPNIEHPLSKTKMNYNELCRAFTVREVAGPLSEILRILLNIIFALQCDEEQECAVKYITIPATQEPLQTMNNATKTHHHVTKYFFKKLNALPLEPAFSSEILRLHLLASGAHTDEKSERWRLFYRSGYSASEDPGLALRMQQPHILRALKVHSVYELPFSDIMKILNCLICQILSYNGLLTMIAERKNLLHDVRFNLRKLYASENKRHFNLQSEKRKIVEDYAIHSGEARDEENRKKLEIMMNKNVQKIQQKDENEKQKFNDGLESLQKELASLVSYLGSDRAYRNYYIFNSIKGVFIEHLPNSLDTCLTDPPVNNIQLAHCARHKKEVINLLTKQLIKEEEKMQVNNTVKVEEQNDNKSEVANGSSVIVNGNATEPLVNGNDESDKENQSSITNGDIEKEKTEKNVNGEISKINGISSNTKPNDKSSLYNPSPYELFMCTGDPKHCIVHDDNNTDRVRWSYVSEEKDIESLINGLNPMGIREGPLKEQLINLKEALFDHVSNCHKNSFSVEESQRDNYIKTILSDTNKKYKNSNLGHNSNDINEVLYHTCLEEILTLENGITEGNLGKLKVKDIAQWRSDLQNNSYNSQRSQLTYGVKDEEEFEDPGKTLGDTIKYEMEDNSDEEILLNNSSDVIKTVQSFASAILQIEQGIDQKFLKEPFGLKTEPKDEKEKEAKLAAVKKNRQYWEISLMSSTSYAQLFLHMRILIESVMWYKSSVNSKCIVCKKKSDADKMLLCDECNAGTHLYCMEPKLKTIPEGDWYCKNCIIHIKRINPTAAHKKPRKQTIIEDNLEDSDASDEYVPHKAYQKKKKRKGAAKPLCLLTSDNESGDEDDDDESFHAEEESNDDEVKLTKIAKKTRYAKLREEAQIKEDLDKDEGTENEDNNDEDNDDENNDDEEESEEKAEEDSDSDSDSMDDKPLINAKTTTQNENEKRHHTEVNYEDSIEEESDDEDKICCICKCDCSEILCRTCTSWYHFECTNLTKAPRGRWMCDKCKAKKERKRKVDSEYESDEEFSNYAKKPRRSGRSASTPREDPPKKGSRRGRRNEELPLDSVVLYQLLDDIMKHAYAWPFLRPIVKREVPDYYTIIKSPMDFAKVKSKLNMAQYTMNEELLSDIALIFKNCDIYNSRGNDIHRAGASLEKFIVDRCKELNLPYNPSGLQADADYDEET